MAVLFWYLVKVTCPVSVNVHVYTRQVTFYKVSETHGHFELVTLYVTPVYCSYVIILLVVVYQRSIGNVMFTIGKLKLLCIARFS